jgi:uncharacterized protein (TIGR03086 family)
MDERLDTLATILDRTSELLGDLGHADLGRPTPCPDLDVDGLVDHLAVWVQVFAGAATNDPVGFDPFTHHEVGDRVGTFARSASALLDGLRTHGYDRPVDLLGDPLPGEFLLHMVLPEYVGHGWDLARATDRPVPYDEHQAETALRAAEAIIRPEHRGVMFGPEIPVAASAPRLDRLAAFLGRDPAWRAEVAA